MANNLSRRERDGHWYIPGKNSVERQHVHEHETLQILQKLALNGKHEEFFELLETINGPDKKRDILLMCDMQGSQHDIP